MDRRSMAASALNRFGLGARTGETVTAMGDPRGWLHAQTSGGGARLLSSPLSSADYLRDAYAYRRLRQQLRGDEPAEKRAPQLQQARRAMQARQRDEFIARQHRALATADGFAERIVRFWSNHFAISVDKRVAAPFAAPMEREAIRPHAFARFADLLLAVEMHPGMLGYLDNVRSVGVDSRLAQRAARPRNDHRPARPLGLNENLAREILELHTLGVDGGYSQSDVTELARAITGWSLPAAREMAGDAQAGVFRAAAHQPGARNVLGHRYAQDGAAQGRAILQALAVHPATARHLSFKLARHFVADAPPPALVERMARAYLESDGDLPTLYRAMIDDDAAWTRDARKFKTPDDFLLSAMRAAGIDGEGAIVMAMGWQAQLGQPLFQPRSPAGFADTFADWNGADALLKRIQSAQALAQLAGEDIGTPARLADDVLGPHLQGETVQALQRAESIRAGLALFFASPDFQWRT